MTSKPWNYSESDNGVVGNLISRRRLLASGDVLTSLALCSYQRGLRYPALSFEHNAPSSTLSTAQLNLTLKDCIAVDDTTLRAIAPEPSVTVQLANGNSSFKVTNIDTNAILEINRGHAYKGTLDQQVDGTSRQISIQSVADQSLKLDWTVPVREGFEFTVMGDTGGGSQLAWMQELAWTLKRGVELGAQFLIHLGDLNYSDGEYDAAIRLFNDAELPCYVTIVNHDFHHS